MLLPGLLLLSACSKTDYGLTTLALELEVTSPQYGAFLGEEAAIVEGRVSPASAKVTVEGAEVQYGEGGTFSVAVPLDGLDYLVVDVEASLGTQAQRVRIPVFSGQNPVESWPGAATGRLTRAGLTRFGESLGAVVDGLGWETMILDAIPALDTDFVDIYAYAVSHDPTAVTVEPSDDGLAADIVLANVAIEAEINALDGLVVIPIVFGFDQIAIDALLELDFSSDRMLSLVIAAADLQLGKAEFELGSLDGWLVELIVDAVSGFLDPLADGLIEALLADYGTLELGGPLAFETDLMGTSLSALVSDLYTDPDGLGLALGIGIDAPAPEEPPSIPTPDGEDGSDGAHALFAVHEGLFQLLLEDALLSLLGSLDLSGSYGDILGNILMTLPGGDQAPDEGWCIDLDPGDAYVVRMKESVLPVAQLHLPDFRLQAGTGSDCTPWLDASLEMTIDLGFAEGTALDLGVRVPDGAILYYGAEPGTWTEDEVIAGVGGMMGTLIGLAGGFLDLDLGSLLGDLGGGAEGDPLSAALAGLSPRVVDSRKLYASDGSWTPGLYVLSLELWAAE